MKIRFMEHIILDEGFANYSAGGKALGYAFKMRLGYYRGLALSCVKTFEIRVDGAPVDPSAVTFCLNDKGFLLSQLPDLYAEYWYILDAARIVVRAPGGLPAGEHVIDVKLELRSPYMWMGKPREYATIDSSDTRTLRLAV